MKMNPVAKAKIVAALRSGKYVQGQDAMRRETPTGPCFCVWGVICDVSGISEWTPSQHAQTDGLYDYDDMWCGPSLKVKAWVFEGTEYENGEAVHVTIDGLSKTLMAHNDSSYAPKTFAQLADAIEEQL